MIDKKTQTIQQELDAWVKETGFLNPGERIVFSMRIDQTPIVVQEEVPKEILDMAPKEFFSHDRIRNCGITSTVRIHNGILNSVKEETMREFLQENSLWTLTRIPNFGKKTAERVLFIMSQSGLALDDPKWERLKR